MGLSNGILLAQHNEVKAVDVIADKVNKINNKISPIQDEYIEKYLAEKDLNLTGLYSEIICTTSRGKPIRAKTPGQRNYIRAIRENNILFATGPAGTGKTYLLKAIIKNCNLTYSLKYVTGGADVSVNDTFAVGEEKETTEKFFRCFGIVIVG